MKGLKKGFLAGIFLAAAVSAGWASEMSVMWTNLYRDADTLSRRYAVMGKIIQEDERDLIPLLVEAQTELLRMDQDVQTPSDRYLSHELQKMIVRKLADLKAAEASEVLYSTVAQTPEVFLRADAVRALGKIGALEYVPQIALLLRNINLDAVSFGSPEERETMVLACISALERLKDPQGYEPVFFTAMGRYSRGVIKAAEGALATMVSDPTEPLLKIISSNSDYQVKLKALTYARQSAAPGEGKASVAALCLREGLVNAADDRVLKVALAGLRTLSCEILAENGYSDPSITDSLAAMLAYVPKETGDINEILTCLAALGSRTGDDAAAVLTAHLKKLNDLQVSGVTITDQREIRAVIQALGNTGNPLGRPELTRVEFCNWNSAVNREAKAALAKLR